MKKFFCILIPLLGSFLASTPTVAATDLASDLRHAQKTLAVGDYDRAFTEYRHFAEEKDNPLAQFTLGLFYRYGWGRLKDPVAACQWFEKAAKRDIPAAAHFLADCLAQGVGRPADPAKAAEWYEKAAILGHSMSLCSLAELYMTGTGVPKDPAKGLALCRQSAEKAIIPAMVRMGRFLLEGEDNIRDYDEALKWFELAAQKNSPEAQYYLGLMLRDGLGRLKAPETARYWFEMAASQRYVTAYFPTAQLYFQAPVEPHTGKLSEFEIAKAYLWTSATIQRSKDPDELEQAATMLEIIRAAIPETWVPALDRKVAKHLAGHQVQP